MANFGFGSALPLDQVMLPQSSGYDPGGGAMPQAAPQSAPVDPTPAPQPAPQQQGYEPNWWDLLQQMVFKNANPVDARQAALQHHYQVQLAAQMPALMAQLPPGVQAASLLGGPKVWEEIVKNYAPVTRSAGQETDYMGGQGRPGGYTRGTATYGVDEKSGLPYAMGASVPGGFATLGRSLGGDIKAEGGIINSSRTGPLGAYSTPQIIPAGSSGVPFTPTLDKYGGPVGAPPPAAGAQPPMQAPRGIRNQNFGNLKTPTSGPWQGQTGVDKDGYAVFADPRDGMRAALTNLQTYAKQGINTVSGVVSRWSPSSDGNNPATYANFVAAQMGVKPDQQLDMSDPKVQRGLLNGIFNFENTPAAMQAYRAPAAAPASGGGFGQPFAQGKTKNIIPQSDPRYAQFPAGTVLQQSPDGGVEPIQKPEYSPEARSAIRDMVLKSEEYKQANASMAAYKAMIGNVDKMTGPSAYSMLDTFARAINPGAVARPTVIETIEKNLGLPAQLVGSLESKFGQGNLPKQVRQQIIDAVVPFAQAHWDQANALNQANVALAKAHKLPEGDVTAPLDARPERFIVGVGSATQALDQARSAIAKGAPRTAVVQRLHSMGIDTKGL